MPDGTSRRHIFWGMPQVPVMKKGETNRDAQQADIHVLPVPSREKRVAVSDTFFPYQGARHPDCPPRLVWHFAIRRAGYYGNHTRVSIAVPPRRFTAVLMSAACRTLYRWTRQRVHRRRVPLCRAPGHGQRRIGPPGPAVSRLQPAIVGRPEHGGKPARNQFRFALH